MKMEEAMTIAKERGFSHCGLFDAADLKVVDEVRAMCASDKCNMYGRSWSCPPACGTTEEVRKKISGYKRGLLLQTTGYIEDSFDYEAMQATESRHKELLSDLCDSLRDEEDYLPLGSGACTVCEECSYPKEPCRRPDRMISSMEAYGLIVSDVCRLAGLAYGYDEHSITFTGCILFK